MTETIEIKHHVYICFMYPVQFFCLDLHLLQTVLPEGSIRGDTILTEVNQDMHGIAIHRLAHQDVVVVVVGQDLLDGSGGLGLELLDRLLGGTLLLELVVDTLDVGCTRQLSANCDISGKEEKDVLFR